MTVPDRWHVAAWTAGDAAPHGEVSRYADSSDGDGDWDSLGTGGMAACMMEEEMLEEEDLEDQHFSFLDAGDLHTSGWSAADDRSLRSIGRDAAPVNTAGAAAPTRVSAPEPVAVPAPVATSAKNSEPTASAAAVAAAAARVRVAAASNVGTTTVDGNTAPRQQDLHGRRTKDLEARERRARAAEERIREQAERQAKERAELAAVQAKAARLRAVQEEEAAAATRLQERQSTTMRRDSTATAATTAAVSNARPRSPVDGQQIDAPATVATPSRRQTAVTRGPSRPPPNSPLRTCAAPHANEPLVVTNGEWRALICERHCCCLRCTVGSAQEHAGVEVSGATAGGARHASPQEDVRYSTTPPGSCRRERRSLCRRHRSRWQIGCKS